jgi:hypothetical protein
MKIDESAPKPLEIKPSSDPARNSSIPRRIRVRATFVNGQHLDALQPPNNAFVLHVLYPERTHTVWLRIEGKCERGR